MIRSFMICLAAAALAAPAGAQTLGKEAASKPDSAWLEGIKEQDGWIYLGVADAGAAVFALDETPRGEWPMIRVWTRYEFAKDVKVEDVVMRSGMAFGQYDCSRLRQMYFADYSYPEALLGGQEQPNEMQDGEDFVWITPKPTSDEGMLTAALCKTFKPEAGR